MWYDRNSVGAQILWSAAKRAAVNIGLVCSVGGLGLIIMTIIEGGITERGAELGVMTMLTFSAIWLLQASWRGLMSMRNELASIAEEQRDE